MDVLQGVQYFYTSNGQQLGPVEGTELVALAQQGQIAATDNIWSEGFAEWMPPQSFSQLAPLYQAQPQVPSPAQVPAPAPPTGYHPNTGSKRIVKKHLHVKPAHRFREGAKFGRLMWLLLLAGALVLGSGFSEVVVKFLQRGIEPNPVVVENVMLVSSAGALVCLLLYTFFSLIFLGRAWDYLQELPVARTTSGKAVGFLFIPFYNLYWLFVVHVGWATDYNKYLDMADADHQAPRGNSGLAMAYCILAVIGLPVFHPFVMYNMCKGINYLATCPKPEVPE